MTEQNPGADPATALNAPKPPARPDAPSAPAEEATAELKVVGRAVGDSFVAHVPDENGNLVPLSITTDATPVKHSLVEKIIADAHAVGVRIEHIVHHDDAEKVEGQ